MTVQSKRFQLRSIASVLAGALLGCSGAVSEVEGLPPDPPTFTVGTQDYRFKHAPQAARGRVVVTLTNLDRMTHMVTIVQLGPDQTGSVQELVRGLQTLKTVAVLDRAAGTELTFALDLVAGRYGFICFAKDADGLQHVAKGMASEFTVV